jgi:hypothetical protein
MNANLQLLDAVNNAARAYDRNDQASREALLAACRNLAQAARGKKNS